MSLIERIKKRITEDGDCWNWDGATQSTSSTPVLTYAGKTVGVLRAIALEQGLKVAGKIVTNACRNPHCVNPEHLKVTTRKSLQIQVIKEQQYQKTPEYRLTLSRSLGSITKLSPQDVIQIRASDKPSHEISAYYGVSKAHVNSIRRGDARRLVAANNPFQGLMR